MANNLRYCYPGAPSRWKRRVAIRTFQHLVISAYETLRLAHARAEIESLISIENSSYLEDAVRRGRGVVVVTGHFGNVALLPLIFGKIPVEVAFIVRSPTTTRGPLISAFREYYRGEFKRLGLHIITPSIQGGLAAARHLKQGHVLVIVSDFTWGSGRVPVKFHGVDHQVSRAPASLALRTGACLLPLTIRRLSDGTHRVLIESPLITEAGGSARSDADKIMEQFMQILERQVRASPEQWFWHHRRWHS